MKMMMQNKRSPTDTRFKVFNFLWQRDNYSKPLIFTASAVLPLRSGQLHTFIIIFKSSKTPVSDLHLEVHPWTKWLFCKR